MGGSVVLRNLNLTTSGRRAAIATAVTALAVTSAVTAASGSPSSDMDWAELEVIGAAHRMSRDEVRLVVQRSQDSLAAAEDACEGRPSRGADPASVDAIARRIDERPRSIDDAAARGFGLSATVKRDITTEREAGTARLPVSDRCANGAVESTFGTEADAVESAISSYQREVLGDPTIAAARQAWQSCARHHGADIASGANATDALIGLVGAAANERSFGDGTDAATELAAAERRLAVIVATCDDQAYGPVASTWAGLETRWLKEHGDTFAAVDGQVALQWATAVGV